MIRRDPSKASEFKYDLIIIGGGIYGACLSLESARRGLRPLLLERDDFGGATSWNTGRIIHGGLRSLQRLDFNRSVQMVNERQWFLRHFPDLVHPMAFLMPLYGQGLKRPLVFRAALEINDWVSRHRNEGVRHDRVLQKGRILSREETADLFPRVDPRRLKGGGLWYDGMLASPQRLLMEVFRWACGLGATALNYVEATDLLTEFGRTAGIQALDRVTKQRIVFRGNAVVNCAGPWCRITAKQFDRDIPNLFHPLLIFKALLDRPPLSKAALAIEPKKPNSHVYFMYPCGGKTLAGGFHAPWTSDIKLPNPSEPLLQAMIDDLNMAIPGLGIHKGHILRVYAGLIPARNTGSDQMALKDVIYDHSRHGGPEGLISVSGIKYTTARLMGEKVLRHLFERNIDDLAYRAGTERSREDYPIDLHDPLNMLQSNEASLKKTLEKTIEEEAVVQFEDLLLRRTDWLCNPVFEQQVSAKVNGVLEQQRFIQLQEEK